MRLVRCASTALALVGVACSAGDAGSPQDLPARAEAFFRAVYGCDPAGIRAVAHPEVAVSYPIFPTLYGESVIRGVDNVVDFSASFCRRWSNASITITDVIHQGSRVVLVWSFSATDELADDPTESSQRWGGISVFRFDGDRVLEEFGEESSPGPAARLSTPPGA